MGETGLLGKFRLRPPQLDPTLSNRFPGTREPSEDGEIGHGSSLCVIPHLSHGAQTPQPARAVQPHGYSHGYSPNGVCTTSQRSELGVFMFGGNPAPIRTGRETCSRGQKLLKLG